MPHEYGVVEVIEAATNRNDVMESVLYVMLWTVFAHVCTTAYNRVRATAYGGLLEVSMVYVAEVKTKYYSDDAWCLSSLCTHSTQVSATECVSISFKSHHLHYCIKGS